MQLRQLEQLLLVQLEPQLLELAQRRLEELVGHPSLRPRRCCLVQLL